MAVLAAASLLSFVVVRAAETLHASDEYVGLLLAGSTWPALAAFLLGRWLTRRRQGLGPSPRRPGPRRERPEELIAMNAESTVFRASRPAVVVAPGGEGARAAAWLLAWPMRLAATPMGRRLLVAATLAVVAVVSVGYLYDSADPATAAPAIFRPAGLAADAVRAGRAAAGRQSAAAPVRAKKAAGPAEVAAAWWAARQKVAVDKVQSLQQRRISATEIQVLVVAEARRVADAERVRDRPQGPVRLGGAVNRSVRTRAGAVLVALLMLAVMSSRASPGFPLADVPKAVGTLDRQGARGQARSSPPSPRGPASAAPARSRSPTSPAATSASTPTRPRPAAA